MKWLTKPIANQVIFKRAPTPDDLKNCDPFTVWIERNKNDEIIAIHYKNKTKDGLWMWYRYSHCDCCGGCIHDCHEECNTQCEEE